MRLAAFRSIGAGFGPAAAAALLALCAGPVRSQPLETRAPVSWTKVDSVDIAAFNKDVVAGRPTIDVAVYLPSNFDPAFDKVTLSSMLEGIKAAKEIYGRAGVQIQLLWIKTGAIDPRDLAIQSNEIPRVPDTEYVNTYEASRRHPSQPSKTALRAFESIVEPHPDNARTIYLLALQDVIFPFVDHAEGRNWVVKMVRTGGLSFPSYSYYRTLPERLRGVITITNLSTPQRLRRTVAHEIGHKVMNVSHEYGDTDPAHEVFAEGGLMLYGAGEDIPAGAAGRWHRERLHLSPFVYRLRADGSKAWNPDYKDGGHYYDPLYGDAVVRFPGRSSMDPNW